MRDKKRDLHMARDVFSDFSLALLFLFYVFANNKREGLGETGDKRGTGSRYNLHIIQKHPIAINLNLG